jgi:hypothetical protein
MRIASIAGAALLSLAGLGALVQAQSAAVPKMGKVSSTPVNPTTMKLQMSFTNPGVDSDNQIVEYCFHWAPDNAAGNAAHPFHYMTKPGQDPSYHFETQQIPGHDTTCVEDLEHKPGTRTVSVEAGKLKPGVRYVFMGRVGWVLNTGSSLATSPIARMIKPK